MHSTWLAKLLFLLSAMLVSLQPLNGRHLTGDSPSSSSPLRQRPGASSYTNRSGIYTRMSHKFHPGSPFLPAGCDSECALNMTLESSANRMAHRRRKLEGAKLPITTNWIQGNLAGEWYVELKVGAASSGNWDDSQDVLLSVDTGSALTWFQCLPCYQNCYPQKLPVFDPTKSQSIQFQNQNDNYCKAVQGSHFGNGASENDCNYQITYMDQSYSFGMVATDTFLFAPITDGDPYGAFLNIGFGCGRNNWNTHQGGSGGVLGLAMLEGGEEISMPEQMGNYIGQGFSYCLGGLYTTPQAGWLLFGSTSIPSNFESTPILPGGGYGRDYFVDLVDIFVDDQPLGCPPGMFDIQPDGTGGVIVDAGATYSSLATRAYVLWRDAWKAAMMVQLGPNVFNNGHFELCWLFPGDPETLSFPQISLYFRNNVKWNLDSSTDYVAYATNTGHKAICLPLLEAKGDAQDDPTITSTIGGFHQTHTQLIFDITNQQLGWIEDEC